MEKTAQAELANKLQQKGVGQGQARVDSQWNYLACELWRKPFKGVPTRKALWEKAKAPSNDTTRPCMAGTNKHLVLPSANNKHAVVFKWEDYDKEMPRQYKLNMQDGPFTLTDMAFSPHHPEFLGAVGTIGYTFKGFDLSEIEQKEDGESITHTRGFHVGDGNTMETRFHWNPVVPGVACLYQKHLKIIDVNHIADNHDNGAKFKSQPIENARIESASWSFEGNTIGYITKGNLGLWDLRTSESKPLTMECHDRAVKTEIAMIGNRIGPLNDTLMVTSGFDKNVDRTGSMYCKKLKIWDQRKPQYPVSSYVIPCDGSNTSMLHYEPSTGLLLVVEKGGVKVQAFDMTKGTFQFLGNLRDRTIDSTSRYCLLDRKYADTTYGEFMRLALLNKDHELVVERIYKGVKPNAQGLTPGTLDFYPALYPDCVGHRYTHDAKEWVDSQFKSIDIELMSMDPTKGTPECLKTSNRGFDQIKNTEWKYGKLHATKGPSIPEQQHQKLLQDMNHANYLHKDVQRINVAEEVLKDPNNFPDCPPDEAAKIAGEKIQTLQVVKKHYLKDQKKINDDIKQAKDLPENFRRELDELKKTAENFTSTQHVRDDMMLELKKCIRDEIQDRWRDDESRMIRELHEQSKTQNHPYPTPPTSIVRRTSSNTDLLMRVAELEADRKSEKVQRKTLNKELIESRARIDRLQRKLEKKDQMYQELKHQMKKNADCVRCKNRRSLEEEGIAELNSFRMLANHRNERDRKTKT